MTKVKNDSKFYWLVRENIGILSINNPPENYLEQPEFVPLEQMKSFVTKDQIKGLIICGIGRHFSAGAKMDILQNLSSDGAELKTKLDQGKVLLSYLESLNIPVIAAIKGICFGGGLEIALATHIRICSPNALFAFPEINHGLIPGLGGTIRSIKQSKFPETLTMILSGDIVNAEEALEMHLIDKISTGDPMEDAFLLLKKMTTDKPMKVIHSVMLAIRNAKTLSPADALKEETKLFCELASDEAQRRSLE
jgi:enoyl-CoA hydratase/carnithine racemase